MPVVSDAAESIINIKNKLGYRIDLFTWRAWNKEIKDIEKITKDWLKNNQLPSKRVIFEKGNVDLPIGTNKNVYKTRFYYAKTRKIKYFVEDEPAKAIKLSQICRYVFLVDHIYNQLNNLPYNIIRVKNWSEIYDYLKEFE